MSMRDTVRAYGRISRGLHWLLFALIVVQFGIALSFAWFPEHSAALGRAIMLHESVGLLILLTGAAFLAWRLGSTRPGLDHEPIWRRRLAHIVHVVLFASVIAQPLLGSLWVMSGGHAIAFFGLGSIPPFIPASESAGHVFALLHGVTAWVILGALGIHVLAALYHHLGLRDDILLRMWNGRTQR